jgi:HKD family nuclease
VLPQHICITAFLLCLIQHPVVQAQSTRPASLQVPTALFTDPQSIEEDDLDGALLKQISELIQATPPGEEITVCVFKFGLEELARELIAAQKRGVKVRLILNKGDTSKETNKEVKDLMEVQLRDFHYIENDISDKGIIHNKFMLFSRVESTDGPVHHLVLQTSSNFQKKGAKKLQDMLIISSDQLYFCYLDFWNEIKVLGRADQLEHYQYFTCSDQENQAFYFPKRREKEDFGKDEVSKVLAGIKDPVSAEIRFAHGKWDDNREEVIDELQKLRERGAHVEVVTNRDLDKEVRKELKDLKEGIYYLDDDYNMHTKFFLVQDQGRGYVWTGSHNLTERSLRENFEVLLKIEDPKIYQSYLEYFNTIKALADSK